MEVRVFVPMQYFFQCNFLTVACCELCVISQNSSMNTSIWLIWVYNHYIISLNLLFHAEIEDLQLADFPKWLTGACQLPPLGFPKKYGIKFIHGCKDGCKCRPTVSTCDLSINILVHIDNEYTMKEMFSSVRDSLEFGYL